MSVNGRDSHLPMSWVSEKGENETQFRFSFIIRVLAHFNECVRREMRREDEACPPLKKEMSKEFCENHFKSFKLGRLVHLVQLAHWPCTLTVNVLYSWRNPT